VLMPQENTSGSAVLAMSTVTVTTRTPATGFFRGRPIRRCQALVSIPAMWPPPIHIACDRLAAERTLGVPHRQAIRSPRA
jgi:hypothetical protein